MIYHMRLEKKMEGYAVVIGGCSILAIFRDRIDADVFVNQMVANEGESQRKRYSVLRIDYTISEIWKEV